jgi:hypothetical protein
MREHRRTLDGIMALAILGSSVTGVVSLIAALFALSAGESVAASVSLTAAALSFGLLTNALIRE